MTDNGTGVAIEVCDLVKAYRDVAVLEGVSFSVQRGSVFALLGANGSGKTTTINILSTLLAADAGSARVGGFDVATQPAKVRHQISLTGQFAAVDDLLSARENLVLIGQLRHVPDPHHTAADLLATFELTAAADRRAATLSGGMRRRLDIAMSLVGDPPIIFLDEPTTGLDPPSRNAMWLMIRRLVTHGTTVLLTTQYLDEADHLADHIAILHAGRIATAGTPDELKATLPAGLVELDFADDANATAAHHALAARHDVTRTDATLTIATPATPATAAEMADIFTRLDNAGIEPTGFSRQTPTLDDVFFQLLTDHHHHPEEAHHAHAH